MSPQVSFGCDSFSHFLGFQDLDGFEYWYFVMSLNWALYGYVFSRRKTAEAKFHSHHIKSRVCTINRTCHCRYGPWLTPWLRLGEFLNYSYFPSPLGHIAFCETCTFKEWGVMLYLSGLSIFKDYLEFCRSVLSPIYSVISVWAHGYFTLWVVAHSYFSLLLWCNFLSGAVRCSRLILSIS